MRHLVLMSRCTSPDLALDHRMHTDQPPEQTGRKPEVVRGVFADWQLSDAIAPSRQLRCDE
jgi:hypothetical protein